MNTELTQYPPNEWNSKNRKRARELYLRGLTYKEIGAKLKVTRQRAQQFIKPHRFAWSEVEARAKGCCENCHKPLRLGDGHVHHKWEEIERLEDFDNPEMMEYLCSHCHRQAHRGI